jgi:NADPH:quinone reductase-like Zn-dependent oxidoreductase
LFSIVKPGGRVVSVAGVPEPQTAIKDLGDRRGLAIAFWFISLGVRSKARKTGVSYRYLFMHPSGEDLTTIANHIDQGRLRVIVDRAVPFAQIADAMAYLEGGRAKGKVVVTML